MKGSYIFYPSGAAWTVDLIAQTLLEHALIMLDEHNENQTEYTDLLMRDIPNKRLITWFNNRFLTKEVCQNFVDETYEILEKDLDEEDQVDARTDVLEKYIKTIIKLDLIKLEAKIKAEYL